MPLLALQTDSRGVIAVVVEGSLTGRLLGVATVSLADEPEKLAASLKSAFGKSLSGRLEVAVALGPDKTRVRRLSVPPVPDGELPTIVAMQAARDAAVDADGLVVDFLPPEKSAVGPNALLVASAEATDIAFWQELADTLSGKLVAVTPRPLATLPLATRAPAADTDAGVQVVSTFAGDSIDFVATLDGAPYLLRSARGDSAGAERELRRTLLALNDVVADTDNIRVLADSERFADNADAIDWKAIGQHFKADVDSVGKLREAAAATGLAFGLARGETPAINLADPRKPPIAETGRRRQVLLAATAATVLLAGGWMAYERVASLDRQIADKEAEIREARKAVEAFDPYRERVTTLDAWRLSDVTWLDEFERLGRTLRPKPLDSKDFPAESDLRVTQFVATAVLGGDEPGGRIDLVAQARSTSTSAFEARLRDGLHPVRPISTSETPAQDAYKYKYNVLLRAPAEVDEVAAAEAAAEKEESGSEVDPTNYEVSAESDETPTAPSKIESSEASE